MSFGIIFFKWLLGENLFITCDPYESWMIKICTYKQQAPEFCSGINGISLTTDTQQTKPR